MNTTPPSFEDIPLPDLPEGWEATSSVMPAAPTPSHPEMPPADRFRAILHQYWGYDQFRGIQEDIIHSIAEGKDTLGLMPTGGGKSISFQVPALAAEGICIVITPLIALMKDQVAHLRQRGIGAAALHSGQSNDEILRHLDNCIFGAYKFLYVSPERLSTPVFQNKLRRMQVCFITVDEAHCISQWGYDFRPAYLRIAEIRKLLPEVPVLALTATATPKVVKDICEQLSPTDGFGKTVNTFTVYRMSFARDNLRYIVRNTENKIGELQHILRSVPGSAIVYTRSRKGTREVANELQKAGLPAIYYHAGLPDVDKDVRQLAWQEDETRIIVATNAFGMGIDKPDVRLVIHMDLPDSIEAYFQEAGRAGRDGQTAYAVLLYNHSDHSMMLRRIPETFPEKQYVQQVYEYLAYFFQLAVGDGFNVTYEFNLSRFCSTYHLFPVPVVSALHLLTQAGYIEFRDDEESTSRVFFLVHRDELYNFTHMSLLADQIVRSLLRHYCGIFCDYVYIDESLLAKECNTDEHNIYQTLVQLTHQRILHYIPRKRTPYITYLQRRIDGKDVVLSPEVYDLRKKQYIQRLEAILDYATEKDFCRSRFLLEYFGDFSGKNCNCCDICLERKGLPAPSPAIRERIMEILSDGQGHPPLEMIIPGYPSADSREVLEDLVSEELISFDDGFIRLRHPKR